MADENPREGESLESGFYGRYRLIEKIAAGGMAEVYKAKVEMFGGVEKIVVIKRILPQFNGDIEFMKMFEDEAKISSGLQHANLVHVFDFGRIDGSYYLAMDYVEGADLQSVLRECHFRRIPIPMELSVLLVSEMLRGLDYAHRKSDPSGKKMGIVHRDISPANIMISYDGNVKLMDFGIAKAKSKSSTTQIGTLKGKYSYMSPEQARGEEVDFRSDIFSCGIICYELVTGVRPFRGKSELEILERVKAARYDPPKAVNPHIPQRLSDIIDTALQQDREKRFQETGAFCDKLTAVLSEFDNRPDSGSLTKFLRKVFAEDGKKNRTDLSAIMEKAIEGKPNAVKAGTERNVPAMGAASEESKASDSIGPSARAKVVVEEDEDYEVEAAASEDLPPIDFAVACLRFGAPEDSEGEQRIRQFVAEAETEVVNRGGRVERRTAAGMIAYFDTDESQVDHRLRALETARRVADLGRRPGSELHLTVGVCAGVVRRDVTQASIKALAQAIKRSERLAARADGVGVLVDEEVSQHAGEGFVMRRVGESDGMPAFAPIRAAKRDADRPTRPSRSGSGTVGREDERRALVAKLDEVIAGQGARAVALTGPVGIGKSHLVHDVVRSAAGKGASVFIGRCVAAGRHVAFSVYQDLMRDILGLPDGAGKEATTQRLERVISELNLAPSLPQVLKPLYAGARQVTNDEVARMGAALRDILAALSAGSKALVLVVEDLHWGDDPSKAVTAALVDYLRRERVLVIVTQRSDVKDQWLAQRRAVEKVELGPLSEDAILRIAMDRLQLPTLSQELGDHLVQRARGNPFYLLETVRNLSEKGLGGSAVATNRQTLTGTEHYAPIVAKPKVLSDRQQQRVDRVKSAVAPQIRGFADDFRRAGAFIQPTVHAFLDWIVGLFGLAKKVKKSYDPKTAESLTKDE